MRAENIQAEKRSWSTWVPWCCKHIMSVARAHSGPVTPVCSCNNVPAAVTVVPFSNKPVQSDCAIVGLKLLHQARGQTVAPNTIALENNKSITSRLDGRVASTRRWVFTAHRYRTVLRRGHTKDVRLADDIVNLIWCNASEQSLGLARVRLRKTCLALA